MISYQTITDHKAQYRRLNVPEQLAERILYIQNGIILPKSIERKSVNEKLVVLYVGRGTAEKRVHLVAQTAKKLADERADVSVQLLGDVQASIPKSLHAYVHFWGNHSNPDTIQKIYSGADVLILTSVFEGFPMVAMEAMANGLAVVSTTVGDIPYHIKEGENGFLIDEKDEAAIVDKAAIILSRLAHDNQQLQEISERNKAYAFQHFGVEEFNRNYLRLFESLQAYE